MSTQQSSAERPAAPAPTAVDPPVEGRAARARPMLVRLGLVVAVAVVAVAAAYLRTGGSTIVVTQAVVTGLLLGGIYGLVAMGLTLIFGVLDIVNFAHGALMALAMYVTFVLVSQTGMDPYLTLLVSVPLLFLLGAAIQGGLLNRVMGQPLQNQLLLTLAISLIIQNVLLMVFTGNPQGVTADYGAPLSVFGAVAQAPRVIAFVAALLLAGVLTLLLRRTRIGTAIRAVAANPEGARLVGIDVRRIHILTFAIGTACAAAAGTLVTPFVTIEPLAGEVFNITAFVIVVLGGMGNVLGALVGGLLIGLAEQLGAVYFPEQSPMLTVFAVFVLVLFLRPQGLFGSRT
ncbi:branched-chain amino acid transport system permease protein [Spinactinospora alkalitolerans]|uniref:Branched-chain amino acid transport system permease protein n=1 Tax=Spinactinospora alkalitolerans TaxID=687207 RepID=A0A852TT94_9ACTN|nr:branched-chain amino acid ABC transporter permease [Spinactinospora alkalitolerans]NYE45973.1 branched-chain amino acid transport system permease protein [Spinactinospora alkalitolerans]